MGPRGSPGQPGDSGEAGKEGEAGPPGRLVGSESKHFYQNIIFRERMVVPDILEMQVNQVKLENPVKSGNPETPDEKEFEE